MAERRVVDMFIKEAIDAIMLVYRAAKLDCADTCRNAVQKFEQCRNLYAFERLRVRSKQTYIYCYAFKIKHLSRIGSKDQARIEFIGSRSLKVAPFCEYVFRNFNTIFLFQIGEIL